MATFLATAGFTVYATPLVLTTLNLVRLQRIKQSPIPTIRRIRGLGPLLGIALGICIFGFLFGVWLDHGGFDWPETYKGSATLITFMVMWVSNIKLEIWTLEPLRKLDPNPSKQPADMNAYLSAVKRYRTHLVLHSSAVLGFAVLNWT